MSNHGKAVYPRFFDPEQMGKSLREVSSDFLRVEAHALVGRWFHAAEDVDLFIWTDENKRVVKQQLTFMGQVVEWNLVEGTRTGVILEEEDNARVGARMNSETIQFDDFPQPHPLGMAMELIRHASALSQAEQQQIMTNFFKGQKRSSFGSKELSEWLAGAPAPAFRRPWLQKIVRLLRRLIKPL